MADYEQSIAAEDLEKILDEDLKILEEHLEVAAWRLNNEVGQRIESVADIEKLTSSNVNDLR